MLYEVITRQLTLEAADHLLKRWRPAGGGYIQAWGREGDPKEAGRIIIDCLLNLPLLFWAEQQTGDPKYREVAITQAEKTRRYIVRGDDSSYHTFFFDPSTGEPIGGATHQGYTNGSTWTRGQAWGVYGFALAYHYTGDRLFLETSKRMARVITSYSIHYTKLYELQKWYASQCDGDWEHSNGIKIMSIDNPGWHVAINLTDTELEGKQVDLIQIERTEEDVITSYSIHYTKLYDL